MTFIDPIDYALSYGGRCRDCADSAGTCSTTGMPCDPDTFRAVAKHALAAWRFGAFNGLIENPIPPETPDLLPWRIDDIRRGLILFRTSDNAHGYTNASVISDRVNSLPTIAKEELAATMRNIAEDLSPTIMVVPTVEDDRNPSMSRAIPKRSVKIYFLTYPSGEIFEGTQNSVSEDIAIGRALHSWLIPQFFPSLELGSKWHGPMEPLWKAMQKAGFKAHGIDVEAAGVSL